MIWSVESSDAECMPTAPSSEKIQCSSSILAASSHTLSDTEEWEDKFPSMPK